MLDDTALAMLDDTALAMLDDTALAMLDVSEVKISQNCWLVLLTWSQAYPRGHLFQELKKS